MALGATAGQVNRMFLFQGLQPAAAGLIIGMVAAAFTARLLETQLFGVTPSDPITFVIVPLLLLAVATLACSLPTVRATRLDPTLALKAE